MAYNPDKNPFYTDEKDDLAFGRPISSGYGSSSSRKDPFMDDDFGGPSLSKYDQIQQMKQNSMNNQLESTQRALASIYDSEQMGVATAEELVQQGEQLDNVETKLDKINQDMKTSQKHLTSIKSVFGGIKNWWQGKDKQSTETSKPQETKNKTSASLQRALDESATAGARSGPHPAFRLQTEDGRGLYEDDDLDSQFLGAGTRRYDQPDYNAGGQSSAASAQTRPAQQTQAVHVQSGLTDADDKFSDNLDMMCSGMERLKGLAQGLGGEIERQNEQVDRVTGKSDRADIKLKDQNRQMRKILR